MSKRALLISLLATMVVASGCGTTQTPAASIAASSPASSLAVVASPSPTASASASAAASPTPSPTATPAPTPAPTPEPWKTYKSKRYRYTIKYPPDWIVTPGTSGHSDQIDDFNSHFVYVFRDTVSTSVDLNGTVAQEKALYRSHYKAKLLTDKTVHVGAYSGRILTFNGVNDGRKFYIQVVIIKRGNVGYFIEMFSDRGHEAADRKLFLRIYNSFKPQF